MADGIRELTEAIVSWKDEQDKHIAKLDKILLGNGEIGLCETVRALVKGSIALWLVVGIVGLALITGVVTIILR